MNFTEFSAMVDACCAEAHHQTMDTGERPFSNGLSDELRSYILGLGDEKTRSREVQAISEKINETLSVTEG